jgi:small-conductance mechanosensitive channel
VILVTFSAKLSGITVFLGVAGAGIAFALQEIIVSAAGFLAINFSKFYSVGDRVMLGGIKGDVIDIGLLRTSLMQVGDWVNGDQYNGKMVRVANSFIFKEPVYNYSGEFPFLWDEVVIPLKTESDYHWAKEEFLKILNEVQGPYAQEAEKHWQKMTERMMIEDARVKPMVHVSFDQNWISFTLRYVVDYKLRRSTKDQIFTKCLDMIRASEGRLIIASAAIEITAFPDSSQQNQKS